MRIGKINIKVTDYGRPLFDCSGDDPNKLADEINKFLKRKFK